MIFLLASASRRSLGPTQPPIQWVSGVLSLGVKRGRGVMLATHPHLVPRLSMSRSYTSSPPCASMACSAITLPLLSSWRYFEFKSDGQKYKSAGHTRCSRKAFLGRNLNLNRIWGSHGGEYEDGCLLGCSACSLVEVCQRFRGPCCLHNQGGASSLQPRRQLSKSR
jgi:hypothetical protein